jgi:multiple sugar transport system substrate-binding protein
MTILRRGGSGRAGWRWRSGVLALLLLMLLSGCGTGDFISTPSKVSELPDASGRTVEYWHTYSDEETRILEQELIPAFEQTHPGIRIQPVRQANNDQLKNTLFTRAVSQRGPDVVRMDIAWIPEFVQRELLLPLEENSGFADVRRQLRPDVMSLGERGGHAYSLPLDVNTKIAIYNKRLLHAAGLTKLPESMRDILAIAERTGSRVGIGGLEPWAFLPYLYAMGGSFLNPTYTKASGYLNSSESVQAVQELVDGYNRGVIDPILLQGKRDIWWEVKDGSVLMTDEGPWFYSVLDSEEQRRALENTLRAPVPALSPDRPTSIVGGESLVLLKNSHVSAEAWVFMEWMVGKEAQLDMAKTGMIPTNLEAVKELSGESGTYTATYLEALRSSFLRPPVGNWTRVNEAFRLGMKQIFEGKTPVKAGLDQLAAQLDALLR